MRSTFEWFRTREEQGFCSCNCGVCEDEAAGILFLRMVSLRSFFSWSSLLRKEQVAETYTIKSSISAGFKGFSQSSVG